MYNDCHVCSRTTQIPETSRFQEEIRFCGIFPLDRGIAGVDAISRDGWEVYNIVNMSSRYLLESMGVAKIV